VAAAASLTAVFFAVPVCLSRRRNPAFTGDDPVMIPAGKQAESWVIQWHVSITLNLTRSSPTRRKIHKRQ
jgi:ABC-type phosphate/phosphonate transport system permease subunit